MPQPGKKGSQGDKVNEDVKAQTLDVVKLSKGSSVVPASRSKPNAAIRTKLKDFWANNSHIFEEAGKGLGIGALVGLLAFGFKAYREGSKKPLAGSADLPLPVPYLKKNRPYMEYIRELNRYSSRAPLLFNQLITGLNHLCLIDSTVKEHPTIIRYDLLQKFRQWTMYTLQACDSFASHVKKVTLHLPMDDKLKDNEFNLSHWDERTRQLHRLIQQTYRMFMTKAEHLLMQQRTNNQPS